MKLLDAALQKTLSVHNKADAESAIEWLMDKLLESENEDETTTLIFYMKDLRNQIRKGVLR